MYSWKNARSGKCGSILLANVGKQLKIIGLHTIGVARKGIAGGTILSREAVEFSCPNPMSLEAKKKNAPLSAFIALADEDLVHGMYKFEPQVGFVTPQHTNATDTTTFFPTAFKDFQDGPPKIPAILTKEAYNKAVLKEQTTIKRVLTKDYTHDVINSIPDILQVLLPTDRNKFLGCRTLTVDEALFKYKDLIDFDKTTSEGMRLKRWRISKEKLLAGCPETYARFREYFDPIWHAFCNGEFTYQLCADKLKDEPRDHERVEQMKTRIFNVTDFVDNLILKMCCGDFVQKTKSYFMMGAQSCGINPYSEVWAEIYRMFDNLQVLCTDIQSNDHCANGSCKPFYEALSKFYTRQQDQVLFLYGMISCMFALRFNCGKGRYNGTGNSSGNWITTMVNTVNTTIWFTVAGRKIFEDIMAPTVSFASFFRAKFYSDDNLSAVITAGHPNGHPRWTGSTVVAMFQYLFGIVLTATNKSEDVVEFDYIQNCDFLSRGFRKENGMVYCPLSRDSMLSQLYYVRMPKDQSHSLKMLYSQLQINLDNVSREIMEYERDEAVRIAEEIAEYIAQRNLPVKFDPDFKLSPIDYKAGVS